MKIQQTGIPVNLTASGDISQSPGGLLGFYVNSTTSGTIVIREGGPNGRAISGTSTPSVGWHTFPAIIVHKQGAYATLGATINVTFFLEPGE